MTSYRACRGVVALLVALPCATFAQTVPAGSTSTTGETIVLSPFTVDSGSDQGYRASNTLSGTRLKASLTDVPSSVTVFTKEFLDDIGATNIQDAYLYSVSTENENEFARNDTEG